MVISRFTYPHFSKLFILKHDFSVEILRIIMQSISKADEIEMDHSSDDDYFSCNSGFASDEDDTTNEAR